MTAEEYRQRMIQAFHNADCDHLIAVVVQPKEKEFEHLEWLLKTIYKQEPCTDAVNRQVVLDEIKTYRNDIDYSSAELYDTIKALPPVNPIKAESEDEE